MATLGEPTADGSSRFCPIHCIVPPHMLKEIARRGNARQQAWAWQTLTLSELMRGQRRSW